MEKSKASFLSFRSALVYVLLLCGIALISWNTIDHSNKLSDLETVQRALTKLEIIVAEARHELHQDSAREVSVIQINRIKSALQPLAQHIQSGKLPESLSALLIEARNIIDQGAPTLVVRTSLSETTSSTVYIKSLHTILLRSISVVETEIDSVNGSTRYSLFATILFLALGYSAFPVYNYVRFKVPAKKLAEALKQSTEGHEVSFRSLPTHVMPELSTSIKNVIEVQQRSLSMITGQETATGIEGNDPVTRSLAAMQEKLNALAEKESTNAWVADNISALERILKTETDQASLAKQVITLLTKTVDAGVGVLYGLTSDEADEAEFFYVLASYGFYDNMKTPHRVYLGEGVLGEVGMERKPITLSGIPHSYLVIHSGLGSSPATDVLVMPLLFKEGLYGAIELASFRPFLPREVSFLQTAAESIAAHLFNQKINADAKRQLEQLADKQAQELVEIHRLQEQTFHKLELKLREVEEQKVKNEAILEGCVDGVISFNELGEINFCNKAASEIWAMTKDEIMTKKIFDLIPIRIDSGENGWNAVYTKGADKDISVRTEAVVLDARMEPVDVLITSTRCDVQSQVIFTFFLQKISVDLF